MSKGTLAVSKTIFPFGHTAFNRPVNSRKININPLYILMRSFTIQLELFFAFFLSFAKFKLIVWNILWDIIFNTAISYYLLFVGVSRRPPCCQTLFLKPWKPSNIFELGILLFFFASTFAAACSTFIGVLNAFDRVRGLIDIELRLLQQGFSTGLRGTHCSVMQ